MKNHPSSLNLKSDLETCFIPSQVPSKHLMLVLHGLGDSIEGYFSFPKWLEVDNLNYLLVNAPNPHVIGYSWFDMESFTEEEFQRSHGLLSDLIDELSSSWEHHKLLLFGFSQGGFMALKQAFQAQKVFAKVFAISTYFRDMDFAPENLSPVAQQQKLFITHGLFDEVLPLKKTEDNVKKLQDLGFHLDWKVYSKSHTIDMKKELLDLRRAIKDVL